MELGATGLWLGLIYSGFSITRAVLQTPVGRLADRRSKKWIICLGLSFYGSVSLLYPHASSPLQLVLIRLIHGVGSAMVIPVAMAYAVELTPKGKEGRYMGMMNTAMFAGFGAGPLLGGYIFDLLSLHMVFYSMTSLIALSLLLTILLLPSRPSSYSRSRESVPLPRILSNRRLLGALIYRVINAMGRGSIMGFLAVFAVQTLGISYSLVGVILALGIFANSLLQTPFGVLADRYNRVMLVIIGTLPASIGYFYLAGAGGALDLTAARLVISLGGALSLPAMAAIVAEEGREMGAGSTMGVLNTGMSLGQIAGSMIAGTIMDLYGIQASFIVGGLLGIVTIPLFYILAH
jgi:MFS family permease